MKKQNELELKARPRVERVLQDEAEDPGPGSRSSRVLRRDYRGKPHGLEITDEALSWAKHASVYHSKADAEPEFRALAQACEDMLITILRNCPPGADRTTALNRVREARLWANSSIALEDELG